MKYVLVSGGVISGIGKGVIGKTFDCLPCFIASADSIYSLFHWPVAEDDWAQDKYMIYIAR